jgi:imidazolonepropionase-like amidohydrolase
MKLTAKLLTVLVIAIANLTLAQSGKESDATKTPITAFVNVNVVPMDRERVIENQTVIVRDGRIAEIGPANKIKVPDGATRIDGAGKYLMPGLAEMHGHIPPPNAPKAYTEAVLFLYVANGITTVRGMLGAPNQLELRDRANRGEIVAPTLYLAGPSFNDRSVNSPEQAVSMVRQQKQEGWDLLKVHPGLTRDEYDAMAKTAREVGIRFAGHIPADVGLIHALEMGQETIDHVDGYIEYLNGDAGPVDEAKLADVARRTKAAGAWIVPTMALWETLIGYADLDSLAAMPELKYAPPQQVEQWKTAHRNRLNQPNFDRKKAELIAKNRMRILKALHDGGVRMLLGTDAPQQFSVPGFSIHREMAHMVRCGFTPYQIIQSGTKNVGDYYKDKDNFGAIEAGKRADLILVEANPLKDVASVARRAGVMARGRWLPESEIRRKLDEIAASWRTQ